MREVDRLRRFLFENEPLRGHWVRLEESWSAARVHQGHGAIVTALLGETMAAASLLAAALKFQGTLTLQVTGGGVLSLLIAQATHDQKLRAVAQLREDAVPPDSGDFRTLVGDGRLVVTVDRGEGQSPWQGIVPLAGATLAECLERYFEDSEQLSTRIVLAADANRAAGLMLQRLPTPTLAGEAAEGHVREVWDEAALLMSTVKERELLDTEAEPLLLRVFGANDLRLFDADPVRFQCRCSEERVASVLQSLGETEIRSVLEEQGVVTVTCEFCQRPYRFDAIDVEQLFAPTPPPEAPDSLN